jgi:hypothetical protein
MVLPNFSVSFSTLYGRNFDAFQEHHQVRPDQFQRGVFTHFQATKSTLFQFLVPDSKAITIPHEQLDLIPPFIDEDENISAHQVMWNMFPHQTRQAAEALAHIRSLTKKEVTLLSRKLSMTTHANQ